MADRIAINAAAAGTAGSSWRKLLPYAAKAIGNYVLNETNFAGLGQYLPCPAIISLHSNAGATSKVQVSNDNGTTWFDLVATAAAGEAGAYVYLDTASTLRLSIAGGTCDVKILVQ